MENIFRIFSPDFRPSDLDILNAYETSDISKTAQVTFSNIKIKYVIIILYLYFKTVFHYLISGRFVILVLCRKLKNGIHWQMRTS